MPDLLPQMSDDQLALSMCFAAVLVSGLIMHFSHFVGQMSGRKPLAGSQPRRALKPFQPVHPVHAEQRGKAA